MADKQETGTKEEETKVTEAAAVEEVKADTKEAPAEVKGESEGADVKEEEEGKPQEGKEDAPAEGGEEKEEVKDEQDDVKKEDEEEEEEEKEPPPPKEVEEDAPEDPRERLASVVQLSDYDCTLDTYLSGQGVFGGTIVSSLSAGGFQYLLSGARATAGAKSGRYYFEVRTLEKRGGEHFQNELRVGFSLAGSSVLMGDSCGSVSFDQEGFFVAPAPDATRANPQRVCKHFGYKVAGVVLNLDPDTPNANTASLFLDGVRACPPQKIPEHLHGKALFPTVTFKNMTLAVNLGTDAAPALKKLPFKCRMFGDLSAADAEVSSRVRPSAGTKYNVVVPVGLPSEGFFDFVDKFLERNPEYEELSDRKIMEWLRKSGMKSRHAKGSRDRPVFNFGINTIDKGAVKNMLTTVSQFAKRHYIVAEVKSNLVRKEREEVTQRFAAPHFEVVANVAVGEPTSEHKDWVHQKIRAGHAEKKAEAERRRRFQQERAAERKAKFEKGKKARLALKLKRKAKQGKDKAASDDAAEKEKEENDGKDEAQKEEKDEAKDEDAEGTDEPPAKKQKLNDEEEAANEAPSLPEPEVGPDVWYVPQAKGTADVAHDVVAANYADFTFPSVEEGFARVEFEWQSQAEAEAYLSKWVLEKKATMIIEDLKPSEWFAEKLKAWQAAKKEWKDKQRERREKQKAGSKGTEKSEEQKFPEDLPDLAEFDSMNVSEKSQSMIYAGFQHEDWLLFSARYELHLLAHAFLEDAKDSEYIGVPVMHLLHYYKLYFKTAFNYGAFGCSDLEGVVELVKDTLKIEEKGKSSYLVSLSGKDEEFLKFAKLVEEDRRDRIRRVEAGDEGARLKFPKAGSAEARAGPGRAREGAGSGGKSAGKTGKAGKGKAKGKGRGVRSWDSGQSSEHTEGAVRQRNWIKTMKPLRAKGSKGKGQVKGQGKGVGKTSSSSSSTDAPKPWAAGASSGGRSAAAAAPVRSTWGRTQRPGGASAPGGYRQQHQAWERKRPYPGADTPWSSQGKTMRPPPAPPALGNTTTRREKGGDKGKGSSRGSGKGSGQQQMGTSRPAPASSSGKASSAGADRQRSEGAVQRPTSTSKFAPSTSVGKGSSSGADSRGGEAARRQGPPQRPSSQQGSSNRPSGSGGGGGPSGGKGGAPRGGDRDRDGGRGPRPGAQRDGGREAPSRGFGSGGERRDEGRNREPIARQGGRDRDQRGAPSNRGGSGGKGGRQGDRDRRPRW